MGGVLMSVGVMTVGVTSVGEITVGAMTVGVMRWPDSCMALKNKTPQKQILKTPAKRLYAPVPSR